jgi:PKHD-type hydroxylase
MKTYNWHLTTQRPRHFATIPQVFTSSECEQIIKICSELPVVDGKATGEVHQRKSHVAWVPSNQEDTTWIFERCDEYIREANDEFFRYDLSYIENLQFTLYDEQGSFYAPHTDDVPFFPQPRKLSFSIQLSETDSYVGGDLKIHVSSNPFIANRTQGTMTAFNSLLLHEVTPMQTGKRFALVGWVVGPDFK